MSTTLRQLNERLGKDCDEALRIVREELRSEKLLTNYTRLKQELMWAEHNIVQDQLAAERAAKTQQQAAVQIEQPHPVEPQFSYHREEPTES